MLQNLFRIQKSKRGRCAKACLCVLYVQKIWQSKEFEHAFQFRYAKYVASLLEGHSHTKKPVACFSSSNTFCNNFTYTVYAESGFIQFLYIAYLRFNPVAKLREFDQSCSKTRTCQGCPGACTPRKILIFEVQNGHSCDFSVKFMQ